MKEYLVKQPNHDKLDQFWKGTDFAYKVSRGEVNHCFMAHQSGLYRDAGYITAKDLDEVFHIGNCKPEQVEKIDTFYSVSTGDIILDIEAKQKYVVASFGFDKI